MKRLMVAKNLVLKIQNLVMNNKSQPIKSNPGIMNILLLYISLSLMNYSKFCKDVQHIPIKHNFLGKNYKNDNTISFPIIRYS